MTNGSPGTTVGSIVSAGGSIVLTIDLPRTTSGSIVVKTDPTRATTFAIVVTIGSMGLRTVPPSPSIDPIVVTTDPIVVLGGSIVLTIDPIVMTKGSVVVPIGSIEETIGSIVTSIDPSGAPSGSIFEKPRENGPQVRFFVRPVRPVRRTAFRDPWLRGGRCLATSLHGEIVMSKQQPHRSLATLKLPTAIAALISLAKAIVVAMTKNIASFPSPQPTLATVSKGIADLETAEAGALSRLKGAVTARNNARSALVVLLEQLKAYVQTVADANMLHGAEIIQSAAMEVKKAPQRAKRSFAVKQGPLSGSVEVITASAGPHAAYEWETSIDGGKTWQLAPSTMQAKTSFTGLAAGSTFMVRYRVLTRKGEGDWAQPISFLVK